MVDQGAFLSRFRPQDVAVMVALVAAVFLFRAPDEHSLKPVWQLDLHRSNGSHHRDLLPKPIIVDLDNDGTNELVVATADAKVKVMVFPVEDFSSENILPHLHIKAEYSLLSEVEQSNSGVLPVAMAAGCQEHVMERDCNQVIVVVTSDWTVHCMSNFLKPIWKTSLQSKDHPLQPEHIRHDHTVETGVAGDLVQELVNKPRIHRPVQSKKAASNEADHFSTYALDSWTGQIRWRHEPGDFVTNQTAREELLSAYHFKLALHSNQYHAGEVRWEQYQASVLRSLPLRWAHPSDTNMKIADFRKGKTGSQISEVKKKSWLDLGFTDLTSDTKGTKNRTQGNAIVIQSHTGLEVLNIQSGQPLCRYVHTQELTTAGDLNGDDVIDHVSMHFSAHQLFPTDLPSCSAIARSGSRVLFTGPVCASGSLFDWSSGEPHEVEPLLVAPLLVPSPPHRTGLFRHVMGHNLRQRSRAEMDAVFLVSTGKLTSYGPHGEQNWQVTVEGAWAKHVRPDEHGEWTSENGDQRFFPSLQSMRVNADEEEESAVLVSGWYHISLVSLVDGTIMASHSLPCQPVAPVVNGDFTNDGLTDVVVQCSQSQHCIYYQTSNFSYLGFALERRPGYLWTAIWVVSGLVVALLTLGCMRFVEEELL
ncbi:predicted protein [Nematostella vectensis]|uniref:Uncharacterized protein n=1 Tax=Nematostella vectensis TaxID=45351 RepID=A7SHV6_NEMVE|nr:predicted protein [Nematostella vectensis]|eukprot:XP_001628756.1 predicted protein [Nematostella vectensis]